MAEALVDEMDTGVLRYYCHKCSREIAELAANYSCPICNNGFVEPLLNSSSATEPTPTPTPRSRTVGIGNNRDNRNNLPFDSTQIRGSPQIFNALELERNQADNSTQSRQRVFGIEHLSSALHDFLVRLPMGQHQYFVVGDPNDYAWGHDGFDTIVTQMLNQMETSGPPPLSKDKIDEIAQVKVTTGDVEQKLQCTICWELFELEGDVRKLPCTHLYHEHCIVPWLKLHGTCPICRNAVCKDAASQNVNASNIDRIRVRFENATRAALSDMQVNDFETPSSSRNAQNETATNNTSTSNTVTNDPNSMFRFDDDQFNLD